MVHDIFDTLGMNDPHQFTLPVFRESLYYDVWFIDTIPNPFVHLKEFVAKALGSVDGAVTLIVRYNDEFNFAFIEV